MAVAQVRVDPLVLQRQQLARVVGVSAHTITR